MNRTARSPQEVFHFRPPRRRGDVDVGHTAPDRHRIRRAGRLECVGRSDELPSPNSEGGPVRLHPSLGTDPNIVLELVCSRCSSSWLSSSPPDDHLAGRSSAEHHDHCSQHKKNIQNQIPAATGTTVAERHALLLTCSSSCLSSSLPARMTSPLILMINEAIAEAHNSMLV